MRQGVTRGHVYAESGKTKGDRLLWRKRDTGVDIAGGNGKAENGQGSHRKEKGPGTGNFQHRSPIEIDAGKLPETDAEHDQNGRDLDESNFWVAS